MPQVVIAVVLSPLPNICNSPYSLSMSNGQGTEERMMREEGADEGGGDEDRREINNNDDFSTIIHQTKPGDALTASPTQRGM